MVRKAFFSALIAALLPCTCTALAKDIVPNTIDCSVFSKMPDGSWQVEGSTTFDAGAASQMTLSNKTVSRRALDIGGADLFDVIEAKCGSTRR